MKQASLTRWILPAVIGVLALADGFLHLALDFVLFHGNLVGPLRPPGAPPGGPGAPSGAPSGHAPPHLPLPLNQLFLLNFIGFVVLVLVYWFGRGLLGRWRWLMDVVLIVYTAASIAGWIYFGEPNPNQLGYLSKAIEILLIVLLLTDVWVALRNRGAGRRAA